MTPLFHPCLVNPPGQDPGLYVDFLFSRRALLFDLGSLAHFPPRKLLRISHVFVSHTHLDHFIGFDHLLRLCLGRDLRLHLHGPPGFIEQVGHRLSGYTWNLVENYATDFTLVVSEGCGGSGPISEFHCRQGFRESRIGRSRLPEGVVLEEEGLLVRGAVLDHQIPCLAYCLEEKQHVNIIKNRLEELGLAVGPWLKGLKGAIMGGAPADLPLEAITARGERCLLPVGLLRERVASLTPGQKICYVTDAGFTSANIERIVSLAKGADYLFIEAPFLHADAARANERHHLTARQAGQLARMAGVGRVLPFHFSPRYSGREQELLAEVERSWQGG